MGPVRTVSAGARLAASSAARTTTSDPPNQRPADNQGNVFVNVPLQKKSTIAGMQSFVRDMLPASRQESMKLARMGLLFGLTIVICYNISLRAVENTTERVNEVMSSQIREAWFMVKSDIINSGDQVQTWLWLKFISMISLQGALQSPQQLLDGASARVLGVLQWVIDSGVSRLRRMQWVHDLSRVSFDQLKQRVHDETAGFHLARHRMLAASSQNSQVPMNATAVATTIYKDLCGGIHMLRDGCGAEFHNFTVAVTGWVLQDNPHNAWLRGNLLVQMQQLMDALRQ